MLEKDIRRVKKGDLINNSNTNQLYVVVVKNCKSSLIVAETTNITELTDWELVKKIQIVNNKDRKYSFNNYMIDTVGFLTLIFGVIIMLIIVFSLPIE